MKMKILNFHKFATEKNFMKGKNKYYTKGIKIIQKQIIKQENNF